MYIYIYIYIYCAVVQSVTGILVYYSIVSLYFFHLLPSIPLFVVLGLFHFPVDIHYLFNLYSIYICPFFAYIRTRLIVSFLCHLLLPSISIRCLISSFLTFSLCEILISCQVAFISIAFNLYLLFSVNVHVLHYNIALYLLS